MIRYAITGGNHGQFLKRDSESHSSAISDPPRVDEGRFLPFPPITPLLDQVRQLAQDGVDYIQLREKHLPAGNLAALARKVLETLNQIASENGRQTQLLINTRADVAAATAAHGVHLPATPGSLTPSQVRLLYRAIGLTPPILSLACHTLPEIRDALPHYPDLILFSPIFGKYVNGRLVSPAAGLKALAAACALAHPIPVLALGGITSANSPSCLHAGAAGVAGIRLFQL